MMRCMTHPYNVTNNSFPSKEATTPMDMRFLTPPSVNVGPGPVASNGHFSPCPPNNIPEKNTFIRSSTFSSIRIITPQAHFFSNHSYVSAGHSRPQQYGTTNGGSSASLHRPNLIPGPQGTIPAPHPSLSSELPLEFSTSSMQQPGRVSASYQQAMSQGSIGFMARAPRGNAPPQPPQLYLPTARMPYGMVLVNSVNPSINFYQPTNVSAGVFTHPTNQNYFQPSHHYASIESQAQSPCFSEPQMITPNTDYNNSMYNHSPEIQPYTVKHVENRKKATIKIQHPVTLEEIILESPKTSNSGNAASITSGKDLKETKPTKDFRNEFITMVHHTAADSKSESSAKVLPSNHSVSNGPSSEQILEVGNDDIVNDTSDKIISAPQKVISDRSNHSARSCFDNTSQIERLDGRSEQITPVVSANTNAPAKNLVHRSHRGNDKDHSVNISKGNNLSNVAGNVSAPSPAKQNSKKPLSNAPTMEGKKIMTNAVPQHSASQAVTSIPVGTATPEIHASSVAPQSVPAESVPAPLSITSSVVTNATQQTSSRIQEDKSIVHNKKGKNQSAATAVEMPTEAEVIAPPAPAPKEKRDKNKINTATSAVSAKEQHSNAKQNDSKSASNVPLSNQKSISNVSLTSQKSSSTENASPVRHNKRNSNAQVNESKKNISNTTHNVSLSVNSFSSVVAASGTETSAAVNAKQSVVESTVAAVSAPSSFSTQNTAQQAPIKAQDDRPLHGKKSKNQQAAHNVETTSTPEVVPPQKEKREKNRANAAASSAAKDSSAKQNDSSKILSVPSHNQKPPAWQKSDCASNKTSEITSNATASTETKPLASSTASSAAPVHTPIATQIFTPTPVPESSVAASESAAAPASVPVSSVAPAALSASSPTPSPTPAVTSTSAPVSTPSPTSVSAPVPSSAPAPASVSTPASAAAAVAENIVESTPASAPEPSPTPAAAPVPAPSVPASTVAPVPAAAVPAPAPEPMDPKSQWTPTNTIGVKKYDKEFFYKLRCLPQCLIPPELPPGLQAIVERNQGGGIGGSSMMRGGRNSDEGILFPFKHVSSPRSSHGSMGYAFTNNRIPSRSSQKGMRGTPNKIQVSLSLNEDVKLKETENAWKPSKLAKNAADKSSDEQKTEELYNKVRSILNKLTPQKLETLVNQIRVLQIDSVKKLSGVIELIIKKAVDEPNFSEAYARMCTILQSMQVKDSENQNINLRKLLLESCQKQFTLREKIEKDQKEKAAKEIKNCTDPEKLKELKLHHQEEERKIRMQAAGTCRFIGELFKLGMLKRSIMLHCIDFLIKRSEEEPLECLCKLLTTIGKHYENQLKNKDESLDKYFDELAKLTRKKKNSKISSRIRFMIQDVIDLRNNGWVPRRDDNTPKTIDQITKEAAREQLETTLALNSSSIKKPEPRRQDDKKPIGRGSLSFSAEEGWQNPKNTFKTGYKFDATKFESLRQNASVESDSIVLGPRGNMWSQGSTPRNPNDQKSSFSDKNPYDALDEKKLSSISNNPKSVPSKIMPTMNRDWDRNTSQADDTLHKRGATPVREGSIMRSAPPSIQPPAPSVKKPVLDDEAMKNSVQASLEEFAAEKDIKIVISDLDKGFVTPECVGKFVEKYIEFFLEKANLQGNLSSVLAQLLDAKYPNFTSKLIIDKILFFFEIAEDICIDYPKFWHYMADILSHTLTSNSFNFGDLRECFKPIIKTTCSANLLKLIFNMLLEMKNPAWIRSKWSDSNVDLKDFIDEKSVNEFIKENKLEFLTDPNAIVSKSSKVSLSFDEIKNKVLQILRNSDDSIESLKKWVLDTYGTDRPKDPAFIRPLMTAIVEAAIVDLEKSKKLDKSILTKNLKLLIFFVDFEPNLEAHCLYAVTMLLEKLQHPMSFAMTILQALHDSDYLSLNGFKMFHCGTGIIPPENKEEERVRGIVILGTRSFWTTLLDDVDDNSDDDETS